MSSIVGKKVEITIPHINKDGSMDEKKTEVFVGTIVDKFRNGYPNPNLPQSEISCDNYLVVLEDGKTQTIHPSFITKVL